MLPAKSKMKKGKQISSFEEILKKLEKIQEKEISFLNKIKQKKYLSPKEEEIIKKFLYERRKILAFLQNLKPKPGKEKENIEKIKFLRRRELVLKELLSKLQKNLNEKKGELIYNKKALSSYQRQNIYY